MEMIQTSIVISVDSDKLKKDFQKMSESTKRIVTKILKQKIDPYTNFTCKTNYKKVIK